MEVEMKIRGLMMDPVTNMPIVVLKDANGTAVLPDLGGHLRSQRHRTGNRKSADAAPMTHDLLKNVLFGPERAACKKWW